MSTEKKKVKVTSTEDLRQALAAGHDASQIEFDNSVALAAARAEGHAAGKAEGKAEGTPDPAAAATAREEAVKAERKRIADIQALARPGFEAELKAAIDNGDSPEKFAFAVLSAAKDRGITLEAIQKDAPKPAAHGGTGENKDGDDATALLTTAMKSHNERSK